MALNLDQASSERAVARSERALNAVSPRAERGDSIPLKGVGFPPMQENPMVKRLMWSGLVAGLGAIAAIAANRVAAQVWRRVFDEEPPE
jgi:hypothetical protein